MFDPFQASFDAMTTPIGPEAEAAMAICAVRGVAPHDAVQLPNGSVVPRWQGVIFEARALRALGAGA